MSDDRLSFYQMSERLSADSRPRIERLLGIFSARFAGERPQFIICSPGRVNLIGDHVDYHGFSVLPMAIESSILLALSIKPAKNPTIELTNSNQTDHPDAKLEHSFEHGYKLDKSDNWINYILCAYHGLMVENLLRVPPSYIIGYDRWLSGDPYLLSQANLQLRDRLGCSLKLLVDSNLPVASGLSSSSALVCGSAVATSLLLLLSSEQNIPMEINNNKLADDCSKFERLVGVHGGGMDQAVIMTAHKDYAKYVEFTPRLACTDVRLPDNIVWLVSHCGVKYPKAATFGYNTRVLETKLGAAMIVKAHGNSDITLDKTITLAKVKETIFPGLSTRDIIENLRGEVFKNQNVFTVTEVCDFLEITRDQLIERFSTNDNFLTNQLDNKLQILDRCEHVFEESERVERFKSICDTTRNVVELGRLMTESHESLKSKYDCSHPALDKLVSIALRAGALGSRLTGAGWGGCTVTMVETNKYDFVMERLKEASQFTFKTEPQNGCHVIKID